MYWYLKSAEQWNSAAQLALGKMYMKGEGVERNFSEAANWLRMVAENRSYRIDGDLDERANLIKLVKLYLGFEQDDLGVEHDLGVEYVEMLDVREVVRLMDLHIGQPTGIRAVLNLLTK